jgi:hypothetical protein
MIYRFGPGGEFFQENPTVPYEPILYWEIWNEPDLYYMLGEDYSNYLTTAQKADLYARLLIASYNHIRSKPEWNDVKVAAMSAAGVGDEIPDWIDLVHTAVQANGGDPASCYDILSIHPYTHDCPPDIEDIMTSNGVDINYTYSLVNETAKTREVMAEWGNENKPVWFTEVGWSRYNGPNPNGRPFPVTERQQAAYVCRLYAMTIRLGVDQVHVMFVIDGDGSNSGFFYTPPSGPRVWYEQAFAAQNFIRLMPVPKITSAISDGDLGYYAYRINPNANDPNAEPVVMAWNALGPITVNFPVDPSSNYLLYDMLGDSVSISLQNGQLEILIGPYPVYVVKGSSVPSYTIVKPPEELKVDSVTTNLVGLSWIASSSSGIAGYTVLRDGVAQSTITDTSFVDTGLTPNTSYSYSVKAYTSDNVSSLPSNEVWAKTKDIPGTMVIEKPGVQGEFNVYGNFPNPFCSTTRIQFYVPADGHVSVQVFNIFGQLLSVPFEGNVKAGSYQSLQIDGTNLNSGIYFYSVKFGTQSITKRMVLIK